MIRRFREGKPMPREERERQIVEGGVNEPWWIDNSRNNSRNSANGGLGTDEYEQPRAAPKATSGKEAKKLHSEILDRLRQPTDYMSLTANKRFAAERDRSLDVDEMIENEIRGLEREMKIHSRNPEGRISLDSFDPRASIPLSDYEPVFRYNPSRGGGGGGGAAFSRADPRRDSMRLSGASDYLRSSVETLGSTGFRALLDPSLRLGGRDEKSDNKPSSVLDTKPSSSSGNQLSQLNGNLNDVYSNLDDLMKSLGIHGLSHPTGNGEGVKSGNDAESGDGKRSNPGDADYLPESISHITNKLQNDMSEFRALYTARYGALDANDPASVMKEIARVRNHPVECQCR
jgi:hypothetical protein